MTRRHPAFTLIELLVVLGVIVLLASILFPVLMRSKMQAKITTSLSQLKQLHTAVSLYRADLGIDAGYGSPSIMGLPMPPLLPKLQAFGYSDQLIISPCPMHPDLAPPGSDPVIEPAYAFYRDWEKLSRQYLEAMPLFFDPNCNDHDIRLQNELAAKRGNAVRLDGSAFSRVAAGNLFSPMFYLDSSQKQGE